MFKQFTASSSLFDSIMSISCLKNVHMLNKLVSFSCKRFIVRKSHKHSSFSAEKLTNRKVVRISGDNSCEFLQGLITNDMRNLQNGSSSIYTMFLNTKGRVLYDAIIYKTNDSNSFFLDCDSVCVNELVKHLKVYRVRRKIDISSVDSEYCVWAIYDSKYIDSIRDTKRQEDIVEGSPVLENITGADGIIVTDPRLPSLGYRGVIKTNDFIKEIPVGDNYKACRYKLGVGEGVDEFQIGQSFPLEMNCDFLNGVSFDKGCYIGQELTARTYHTGVVRKRLMPLKFEREPKDIPYDTVIDDPEVKRKTPGKFKGSSGYHGIGLMRVSETLQSKSLKLLDITTTAMTPYWWPNIFIQQKSVYK